LALHSIGLASLTEEYCADICIGSVIEVISMDPGLEVLNMDPGLEVLNMEPAIEVLNMEPVIGELSMEPAIGELSMDLLRIEDPEFWKGKGDCR